VTWYQLPPGDYIAISHSTNNSASFPFTVVAPPLLPPGQ
jgi:hypothetical protein